MNRIRGTVLALVTLTLVTPPLGAAQEPGLHFDFQDADLRLVVSALAEAGRLNLVYGQLPDRRVTLRTSQPVPAEQIPALLRSLAAANGLRVVEDGGFLRLEGPDPRAQAEAPGADTTVPPDVRLFVYRLKHARAPRFAATLQSIFGGSAVQSNGAAYSGPRTLSEELREQQIPPADVGPPPPVSVEMGQVRTPSLPGRLRGEVQIVPDEATNSLLVRAQPPDWEVLKQAIAALDLRPLQVLIEVLIVEVRHTTDFALGVSGRIGHDSTKIGDKASVTLTPRVAGDFALHVMRVGRINVDLELRALSAMGDVRIVSRPVLLAQNNQEARILVGSERPFIQVIRALPTDAAVRDQVVQYREVGTQLTMTPTINDDGYVNLQLTQQVSTATTEVQFGAPVISTREASTHLFVRDGQTVVIGGLVDRERGRTRSGVPFLKDLPLLGGLFGSTDRSDLQSELFLFLTPHVVASDEDADRLRDGIHNGAELLRPVMPPAPLLDSTRVRRDSKP